MRCLHLMLTPRVFREVISVDSQNCLQHIKHPVDIVRRVLDGIAVMRRAASIVVEIYASFPAGLQDFEERLFWWQNVSS